MLPEWGGTGNRFGQPSVAARAVVRRLEAAVSSRLPGDAPGQNALPPNPKKNGLRNAPAETHPFAQAPIGFAKQVQTSRMASILRRFMAISDPIIESAATCGLEKELRSEERRPAGNKIPAGSQQ